MLFRSNDSLSVELNLITAGMDCLLCMMWEDIAWGGLSPMYDVGRCCLEWSVFHVMYDVGRYCNRPANDGHPSSNLTKTRAHGRTQFKPQVERML